MKRIVICCDGTWSTPDQDEAGVPNPTNVSKLALAIRETDSAGTQQRVLYQTGVGTGLWDRLPGGAFGSGISAKIKEAYRFLISNFDPGDELFLFGFSRGAYTARSVAGFVRNSGILRREYAAKIEDAFALYRRRGPESHPRGTESSLFRRSFSHEAPIEMIGVWNTVGALGIPGVRRFLYWWQQFHDVELSTRVAHAYHAVAIDERRRTFAPTLWNRQPDAPPEQVLEQVWFAGVHSDVGGGYPEPGLADVAFAWIILKAEACGLALDLARLGRIPFSPDPFAPMHDSRSAFYRVLPTVLREIGAAGSEQAAADTAVSRMHDARAGGYRPPNLEDFVVTRRGAVAAVAERIANRAAGSRGSIA